MISFKDVSHPLQEKMAYRSFNHNRYHNFLGGGIMDKNHYATDWAGGIFKHYSAVYVIRGEGTYIDADGQEYQIKPGTLFQRFPDRPHRQVIIPGSGWLECFWAFRFTTQDLDGADNQTIDTTMDILQSLALINANQPVTQCGVNPQFIERFHNWMLELDQCPSAQLPALQMQGLALLNELTAQSLQLQSKSRPSGILVNRACEIIQQNLSSRARLAELMQPLPISYSRLRELFREEMKVSLGDYQIRLRLQSAAEMLKNGSSASETAQRLGYSDLAAFSKQFRKFYQVSPRQFIKRCFHSE